MEQIRSRFADQVEFFVVYVQEAHPTDGRKSDSSVTKGVLFRQHQNFDEREEAAQTCSLDLHISHVRRKLRDAGAPESAVRTVWGQGYTLITDAL